MCRRIKCRLRFVFVAKAPVKGPVVRRFVVQRFAHPPRHPPSLAGLQGPIRSTRQRHAPVEVSQQRSLQSARPQNAPDRVLASGVQGPQPNCRRDFSGPMRAWQYRRLRPADHLPSGPDAPHRHCAASVTSRLTIRACAAYERKNITMQCPIRHDVIHIATFAGQETYILNPFDGLAFSKLFHAGLVRFASRRH